MIVFNYNGQTYIRNNDTSYLAANLLMVDPNGELGLNQDQSESSPEKKDGPQSPKSPKSPHLSQAA